MRATSVIWWCPKGHRNEGISRECRQCGHSRIERHAQIHSSDRAVIYYNPATGERRTPARADLPMPAVYANQGFERQEIMSMTRFERQTGLVHEQTNFQAGNEPDPERYNTPTCPPTVKEALVNDMRDAIASGPWTGGLDGDGV